LSFILTQPSDCRQLIERLKGCNEQDLLKELRLIKNWNYGKVSISGDRRLCNKKMAAG
jgi:hypothetical protein